MLKRWCEIGEKLAIGRHLEYKAVIEITYLCDDAVMEVMWGLKNLMHSLVSEEKTELTEEDRVSQ
ncbi:hypothetical protein BAE44_0008794 [Dichanthelium oligosanthes]|uniref:Uncharacterized protein n=1 Tax=Dichanthelium oligosanthes TaxID=888268 RepID=A0A1E5VYL7_9POAL|nr:hypothetical protein BAE44_0008794 [Dichanthelium oligosanthes]